MIKRTDDLPVILTSFAFKEESFSALDRMITTVRRCHPDWPVVTGRGPVGDFDPPALDVQSPSGARRWKFPVSLNLDGSSDDQRKITRMKAWWIARVWHNFGHLSGSFRRILWMDADSMMTEPLDIELHTEVEIIAGVWQRNAHLPGFDTIVSRLLLFQGSGQGTVERILSRWSETCLSHIQNLPNPPLVPWGDCDQEVLTGILKLRPGSDRHYILIRLEAGRYCKPTDRRAALQEPWADRADRSFMGGNANWTGDSETNNSLLQGGHRRAGSEAPAAENDNTSGEGFPACRNRKRSRRVDGRKFQVIKRTDEIPVVLTSFAFREEYFPELDGMVASVKRYHPDWTIVTGKGPVAGLGLPTLQVEAAGNNDLWSLPVPLNLDGSVDDWRKITKMKAWWLARVWHAFGHLTGRVRRMLWIDADARINGPLDIELNPETDTIAGAWWSDPRHPGYETIASGFLLLQGSDEGAVQTIVNQWSDTCLEQIQKLPDPPLVPWGDGDQEVLNQILKLRCDLREKYELITLEFNKYCGIVDKDGTPVPGALVDQWVMCRKMKWPKDRDRVWPPPEEERRRPRV